MAKQQAKKKPFFGLLRRRNVEGAVWQNVDSNDVSYYVASVSRSYKDKEGNWNGDVLYVPLDDIPRVIAVLQEAEQKMYEQLQADYEANRDDAAA